MTSSTTRNDDGVPAPGSGLGPGSDLGPGSAESAAAGRDLINVGVLSDTHGHLYPEVKVGLEGVDHLIHAGDVGSPQVLAELRKLAPVTAVRGNCDYDDWAQTLPVRGELELGGLRILVGHMPAEARAWAAAARQHDGRAVFSVVVFGHSHTPLVERSGGVLYLNPGSAGPRRFNRPRTVARLQIVPAAHGAVSVEIVTVES